MTNLNSALISNKITNMSFIFNGCTNLTSKPVCSENVTDMSGAYYKCIIMRNAYAGDKLNGIIPCMSIYEFLNKLRGDING